MSYQVISIGDAEMLYETFQGVAMIFGNHSMNKLIASGFILGIFMVSTTYMTSQQFPLQQTLVGMILYSVLFVPTDTVTLEDVYTGQVRVVANVPLGVAVPMSVISSMGVQMTTLFESAFSTPTEAGLLQNGYLNALNTLMKLRNIGLGSAGSDSTLSGDVGETIQAYIENCVMLDLEINDNTVPEVTREKLQKSTDLWSSMLTSYINVDILMKLPTSAVGEQKSCKDAYTAITTYLTGNNFEDQMNKYVSGVLGITDATVTAANRIDIATSALNLVNIDAQTYMRNALLASYLKDGPSAYIKRTGTENLNLQWASEQTMFNEVSRPLMAFVEMFTVAISPIVAFLTTLGVFGMTMLARYLQLIIWISLWGPLMAICNLYLTVVTTRALDVIASNASANGAGLDAMIAHDQLYQTLETWLSAGGMLASSVPALALMIVYGGGIAATNLAGKMTSGASQNISPARIAPDPVSMESPVKLGSKMEFSPNVGVKGAGMGDTTYSQASNLGRGIQSASDSTKSASSGASQILNSSIQQSSRSGAMSSDSNSITNSLANSKSESDNWAASTGRTIGDQIGSTQIEKESIAAGVSASLSAQLSSGKGINPASIGAGAQAQLQSQAGMDASKSRGLSDQVQSIWNQGYSGSSQVTEMQQSAKQHADQSYFGSEEMKSKGEQYMSQLQAMTQASDKFTETASLQNSSGKSLTMPYQDLARRLNESGAINEIKDANKALESGMSSQQLSQLAQDANHEINNSSAKFMGAGSDERDALTSFLKLNQQDPAKAASLVDKYLTPSSADSGANLSPAQFKSDKQSVNDMVSGQAADSFRSMSKGDTGGSNSAGDSNPMDDINDAMNQSVDGSGAERSSRSSNLHHGNAENSGAGNKLVKPTSTMGSGGKSKVNAAIKGAEFGSNPDQARKQIEAGGKLQSDPIDGTDMAKRAVGNFGNAGHDIAKDAASSAYDTARDTAISASKKVDEVQHSLNTYVKQSVDSFKDATGKNKKLSSNDMPNIPSDNDLPPTPKE